MDTVHGTRSGKVLLTLMFRNCSLMLAFIIDSCSQIAVKDIMDKLYEVLGHEVFKTSFPVILTDNGSEFKNPEALELDADGVLQSNKQITAPQLAKRLEVSVRTIYRDIDSLSSIGVPIITDRGPNGGISLLNEYKYSLSGLTYTDLQYLYIPSPKKF